MAVNPTYVQTALPRLEIGEILFARNIYPLAFSLG